MDLRLTPTTPPLTARTSLATKPGPQAAGAGAAGFAGELKSALQSVSDVQNQATSLQQQVQMENPKVSLEETMVAIQKAQIGFQSALHVRNRMVQAYTDIMNMQV
jgi:flagellar hook-basal body complex protein FliE